MFPTTPLRNILHNVKARQRKHQFAVAISFLLHEELAEMPRQNQQVVRLAGEHFVLGTNRDQCARSEAAELVTIDLADNW